MSHFIFYILNLQLGFYRHRHFVLKSVFYSLLCLNFTHLQLILYFFGARVCVNCCENDSIQ